MTDWGFVQKLWNNCNDLHDDGMSLRRLCRAIVVFAVSQGGRRVHTAIVQPNQHNPPVMGLADIVEERLRNCLDISGIR